MSNVKKENLTISQKGQDSKLMLLFYESIVHSLFLSIFTKKFVRFEDIYRNLREMSKLPENIEDPRYLVLDMACGTGWFGRRILKESRADDLNIFVDSMDISVNSLEKAGKLYSKDKIPDSLYNIQEMNAHNMSYENNRFHEIWLCGSLHQIPGPDETLKETARILKPGGKLFCQTFVESKITSVRKKQKKFEVNSGHIFFKLDELCSKLESNGLYMINHDISKSVILFCAEKRS